MLTHLTLRELHALTLLPSAAVQQSTVAFVGFTEAVWSTYPFSGILQQRFDTETYAARSLWSRPRNKNEVIEWLNPALLHVLWERGLIRVGGLDPTRVCTRLPCREKPFFGSFQTEELPHFGLVTGEAVVVLPNFELRPRHPRERAKALKTVAEQVNCPACLVRYDELQEHMR